MMHTKRSGYCFVLLALTMSLAVGGAVRAAETADGQLATADQLKNKALAALRAGKFDQTNDYLTQAAALARDPLTTQMADWARQFEAQHKVFVAERQKEYEKTGAKAQRLITWKKESYAIELAAKAYGLVEDKDAFRKLPWVVQLLTDAKKLAQDYEQHEQWLKSLRVYAQLSTIEPEVPEWKEAFKTSTRRVRLLALYTPDELKRIQDADAKEREQVEAMLEPTTRPTTKPSDEEAENANRIKWDETLRGVKMDMLREGLITAHANYFRKVSYQQMMVAGLQGLRIVATTPALRDTFKGLADLDKRNQFMGAVDALIAKVQKDPDADESDDALRELLSDVTKINSKTIDLPETVLANEFGEGAFGALDPFSSIIWPSDWEEFQKTTKGEFSGVGIQIQVDEAGNLKVVSPLEDSPAYRAGVKPDWIITHINGRSAKWISVNQAVKQITGPEGTEVTLTIKDTKGNSKDYRLRREIIKVASVKGWIHRPGGGWDYFIDPDQKIAYLRLTNFTKTTTQDINDSLKQMNEKGVRGVIFDLRYNPGGLLTEATNVVDKFVKDGVIVSTRPDRPEWARSRASVTKTHLRASQKNSTPMVVLINQYSASASEIVSGALKDNHRAFIVGERTFGKGSVQMLYPLGDRLPTENPEAVLKLTTSHYYLPDGECIHREENSKTWGVEPDLTIEMTPEQMRAAIDARQDSDILRDQAAPNDGNNLPKKTEKDQDAVNKAKKKDPLGSDPQLSAALLVMRLQLAGGSDIATASATPAR